MISRQQRIITILQGALGPLSLQVIDDSLKHKGHPGASEAGETHYRIKIVSERFQGLTRLQRHQHIYSLLKDELEDGLHALQLTTLTPEEAS